jgi:hypothetical protein
VIIFFAPYCEELKRQQEVHPEIFRLSQNTIMYYTIYYSMSEVFKEIMYYAQMYSPSFREFSIVEAEIRDEDLLMALRTTMSGDRMTFNSKILSIKKITKKLMALK